MGLLQEFKDFALKGNVIDLAVGVIIGTEFSKIVNSLVTDIIMPPIGKLIGGQNFDQLKIHLGKELVMKDGAAVMKDGQPVYTEAVINLGHCIQTIVNFLIIAFCVFLVVKAMNTAKKTLEEKLALAPKAAPEAPPDVKLLTEIRDLLKEKQA